MPSISEKCIRSASARDRGPNSANTKELLDAALADLAALRAAFVALTAKLDTDFTAQNIAVTSSQLDENYASTVDPATLTLTS